MLQDQREGSTAATATTAATGDEDLDDDDSFQTADSSCSNSNSGSISRYVSAINIHSHNNHALNNALNNINTSSSIDVVINVVGFMAFISFSLALITLTKIAFIPSISFILIGLAVISAIVLMKCYNNVERYILAFYAF